MEKVQRMLSLVEIFFKFEDKFVRVFSEYPKPWRKNSFPFYSSDTYSFLCDSSLEVVDDLHGIENLSHVQKLYINGNRTIQQWHQLLLTFEITQPFFRVIVIGDTDVPPNEELLNRLRNYCEILYSVNLVIDEDEGISPIPLGLESQRYRSAGQLRDFRKKLNFNIAKRKIGVLVSWNDATSYIERSRARGILSQLTFTLEVRKRVTARYIHKLMRRSMFVACPRGNGLDTHRFWESLYLGSIPIIVKRDRIPAFEYGPHLAIEDWEQLNRMTLQDLKRIYASKQSELKDFRKNSLANLEAIFGRRQ